MKITKMPGSLKLKYSAGTNALGKEVFKTKLMNGIHPEATDDAVYGLRDLLAEVQTEPTTEFSRVENKFITEE